MGKEYCIMPDNPPYWRNYRFYGSERHEVFEGRTGNRDKSIEDGLVIFTTPELHRTGKHSIHLDPSNEVWVEMKKTAEKVWLKTYNKTIEEFRKRYYKSWL